MSIRLYPQQEEGVNKLRQALKCFNSVVLQSPTGSGKTIIASYIVQNANLKGKNVWFICHRDELLFQTSETFNSLGIDHGFIAAKYKADFTKQNQVCSILTLKNKLQSVPVESYPNIIIYDECHHILSKSWSDVKNTFDHKVKHIGLTATPWRLNGDGLGQEFEYMVDGPKVKWLIENKYLSEYDYYAPPSGVELQEKGNVFAGDYKTAYLNSVIDKPKIIGKAVEHYKKYCPDTKCILYAPSVELSKKFAKQFNDNGIPALHLDAKTKPKDRSQACRDFADDKIKVLCNVDLFSEGFDLAAHAGKNVTIESVILTRPTMSLVLFLQQVGRALRMKNYPATIIDMVGNVFKHGTPCMDRDWSLEGRAKKPRSKAGEKLESAKQCDKCYFVHDVGKPKCPACGHVYEVKPRVIEQSEGELSKIDKKAISKQKEDERKACDTLDDLIKLGRSRGYKYPERWAGYVMKGRVGKKKFKNSGIDRFIVNMVIKQYDEDDKKLDLSSVLEGLIKYTKKNTKRDFFKKVSRLVRLAYRVFPSIDDGTRKNFLNDVITAIANETIDAMYQEIKTFERTVTPNKAYEVTLTGGLPSFPQ